MHAAIKGHVLSVFGEYVRVNVSRLFFGMFRICYGQYFKYVLGMFKVCLRYVLVMF